MMLSRWEAGERPKLIPEGETPALFDSILGTPIVWYYKGSDGRIDLFDKEGFHPQTAAPLLPITRDIYLQWRKKYESSEAEKKAELKRIADQALAVKNKELADKKKKDEDEAALKLAIEKEELVKSEAMAKIAEIGARCDQLTGNEFDSNRNSSFPPVPYEIMRQNSDAAIHSCESAIDKVPNQPRYKYQLARVLQSSGSSRAKPIFIDLVAQNYAAAFDNLGWIYYNEGDQPSAIEYFRFGSKAGNAESMVSYAQFLIEGKFVSKNENEAVNLYIRAAQMGHPYAARVVEELQEKQKSRELGTAIGGAVLSGVLKGLLER